MSKIRFNWELNVGHVVTVLGFFFTAALCWASFAGDLKLYKQKVDEDHAAIQKLQEAVEIISKNTAVTTALLDEHIHRGTHTVNMSQPKP